MLVSVEFSVPVKSAAFSVIVGKNPLPRSSAAFKPLEMSVSRVEE